MAPCANRSRWKKKPPEAYRGDSSVPKFSCRRDRFSFVNEGGTHGQRTRCWKSPSAVASNHPPTTMPPSNTHGTPSVPMQATAAPATVSSACPYRAPRGHFVAAPVASATAGDSSCHRHSATLATTKARTSCSSRSRFVTASVSASAVARMAPAWSTASASTSPTA
ncbi:hypothetical protein COSO111634_28460 [Corallococcus soli]